MNDSFLISYKSSSAYALLWQTAKFGPYRPMIRNHGFRILSSISSRMIMIMCWENKIRTIASYNNETKKKEKNKKRKAASQVVLAIHIGHWGYKSDHDGLSNPYDDPRVYIEIFSSMKYIYKARCSIQRSDDSRRVQSNKAWLTHMPEL